MRPFLPEFLGLSLLLASALGVSACAGGGSDTSESDEAALTASSSSPPASSSPSAAWYVGSFQGTCLDRDTRIVVLERSAEALRLHTTINTGHAGGETMLDYAVNADGSFTSSTAAPGHVAVRKGQCDEAACFFDIVATTNGVTEHFSDTYRRTVSGIQFASSVVATNGGIVTSSSVECDLARMPAPE